MRALDMHTHTVELCVRACVLVCVPQRARARCGIGSAPRLAGSFTTYLQELCARRICTRTRARAQGIELGLQLHTYRCVCLCVGTHVFACVHTSVYQHAYIPAVQHGRCGTQRRPCTYPDRSPAVRAPRQWYVAGQSRQAGASARERSTHPQVPRGDALIDMRQAVWPWLLRHVLLESDIVEFLLRVLLRGGHLRRHLRRTQVLGSDCPFPYVCGTLCVRV